MTAVGDHATQLGWDRHWARWFADAPGDPARVSRVDRGRLQVVRLDGALAWLPAPTTGDMPVTGDWVSCDVVGGQPVLAALADRRTALVRRDPADVSQTRARSPRPSGARPQTLAANMDRVWIVHSVDQPLRAGWLDRALVVAFGSGAQPTIVIAKADLGGADDCASTVATLAPTVPVTISSAGTGLGIERLATHLHDGGCAALLGRSGSGKSSLINALAGVGTQRTAAVRTGDAKGRHTTTRRSLTLVPPGSVIDTPGVRALGLWEPADGLALAFPDIAALAVACRFADCSHRHEPGCAVHDRVDNGELDRQRYHRYITLCEQ
ncbi:ribosome small subunit-dependent GTPase A [soil metagenome]